MDPTARHRLRLLRQYLSTDRLLGVDVVPRGEGGMVGAEPVRGAGAAGSAAALSTQQARQGDSPGGAATAPPKQGVKGQPAPAASAGGASVGLTGTVAEPTSDPVLPPRSPLSREQKVERLERIDREEVRGCTRCPLHQGRTQTVFADGDPDARLMFIGEGPGQQEDEQGLPFVGRAGELLNRMIDAMGLARERVYIANIVKCRPPNNRAPTPQEAATCWDYLRRQILIIQPGAIVTLGGPATQRLLEAKRGITALRGTWHMFRGLEPEGPAIPIMPTFHPAYVLRNYTKETRGKVWSDLQAVMQVLQREPS